MKGHRSARGGRGRKMREREDAFVISSFEMLQSYISTSDLDIL